MAADRSADRSVVRLAENGIYRTSRHRAELVARRASQADVEGIVQSHERRSRGAATSPAWSNVFRDGEWRVPGDLAARALAYERQRLRAEPIRVRCHLPLDQQARALGATWLDELLLESKRPLGQHGFPGRREGGTRGT